LQVEEVLAEAANRTETAERHAHEADRRAKIADRRAEEADRRVEVAIAAAAASNVSAV